MFFFILYYQLFSKIVLYNSQPASPVCICRCCTFLCGLTILSFQSMGAEGDIILFSVIKWDPAVECRAETRVCWWCVWETERLVVCPQCSMLTAVFLRLTLVSSQFRGGQSHFAFLVSCFCLFSHAVYFLLSTFPFISSGNALYHCHTVQFHLSVVSISGRV